MERPVYCFIDDSSFEIELFDEIFQPSLPEIEFLCTSTFSECKNKLDSRNIYPSLFILDLYGRSGKRTPSPLPSKTELEIKANSIMTLSDIYDNLDYNDPNIVNEFLKRLFTILNSWRNLFADTCYALDQSNSYGLSNLRSVKTSYPLSAAVIYTRKAMFMDAVEIFNHSCEGIFIKPMGNDDSEIKRNTKAQLKTLTTNWNEIVRKKYVKVLEDSYTKVIMNSKSNNSYPNIRSLIDILKTIKIEDSGETNAIIKLREITESLPTAFTETAKMTTPFLNGLKLWSRYYYSYR